MANDRTARNVFKALPALAGTEAFLTLINDGGTRIEQIVSKHHASPPGFWYDQEENEWVIVLRGNAVIEFADGHLVEMVAGDYLTIPRHARHRVARTDGETVWLAVYISEQAAD